MKRALQRHPLFDAVVWAAALVLLLVLGLHEAQASEHRYDLGTAVYRDECGSCHVAYPAALMAPAQWAIILGRLDRHYGVDATLDALTVRQIGAYLAAPASTSPPGTSSAGDLPRISTQPWFLREHRSVTSGYRSNNRSMSDCAACHTRAAQGDYSESTLRVAR